MSDLLEQLCRSARVRRARWDKVPWCTLSIELKAVSCQTRCYVGVALIDRRQVGYLINGDPRSFRVEPGEHTVTVYLARTARIPDWRKATISRRVVLWPREKIQLICGTSSEITDGWRAFRMARTRMAWASIVTPFAAAGASWLSFPFLRESIAYATLGLDLREPWLSLFYLPVSSRPMTAAIAASIVSVILQLRLFRWLQDAKSRLREPYFLVEKASAPTGSSTKTI
jgi:hypothetical protein